LRADKGEGDFSQAPARWKDLKKNKGGGKRERNVQLEKKGTTKKEKNRALPRN